MRIINYAVFRKVLNDYLNVKNLLIYLVIVSIPSLFFTSLSEEAKLFSNLSLELKTEYMSGFFLLFSFFWICGISIVVLSSVVCSSFVAEEIANRTLLLLVAKPVNRTGLIISKFFAFMIIALVFSSVSIFFSIYLWTSLLNLDFYSLSRFASFVPLLIGYSFLVSLIFGSLATALSVVSSNKLRVILPVIAVLMLTFFALIPIRGALIQANVYESHAISLVDLGYDLGNVYISLLEASDVKLIPPLQTAVGTVTGVYEIPREGVKIDYDHGFVLPSLDRLEYRSFRHSLLKWTVIPLIFFAASLVVFERRDIS